MGSLEIPRIFLVSHEKLKTEKMSKHSYKQRGFASGESELILDTICGLRFGLGSHWQIFNLRT